MLHRPGGSWHGQIPVLLFPKWLSASEGCLLDTTANSTTFHSSRYTLFLHQVEKKHWSFSHITFPNTCLQQAARFSCVYPIWHLLLSLCFLEDWAGTLSDDAHIINTTACSALLNIHVSRKSRYLFAWASFIKKYKKHSGKSLHSSLKTVETNSKKKMRTSNIQLWLFLS